VCRSFDGKPIEQLTNVRNTSISSQTISYITITPAKAIKNPNNPMAGPTFKAPAVALGVLTLLVALVPVPELVVLPVRLGVGTVSGAVPRLLKLVELECGILTGPGAVGKCIVDDGTTDVIVSVCGGLRKVSVTTVVIPSVGISNVLPDFVPLKVPMVPLSRARE
jgi:hypothetical protein